MLSLDVTSDDSVARCVEEVLARAGQIDVLVNNAGASQLSFAEETPIETVRVIFETNFFGAVRMTNAVLPRMRERRAGRIINVESLAAWIGEPGEAFYSGSTKALSGYTEALRYEVRSLGIQVSLVEPGEFRTNFLETPSAPKRAISYYDPVRQAVQNTLRGHSKGAATHEK